MKAMRAMKVSKAKVPKRSKHQAMMRKARKMKAMKGMKAKVKAKDDRGGIIDQYHWQRNCWTPVAERWEKLMFSLGWVLVVD